MGKSGSKKCFSLEEYPQSLALGQTRLIAFQRMLRKLFGSSQSSILGHFRIKWRAFFLSEKGFPMVRDTYFSDAENFNVSCRMLHGFFRNASPKFMVLHFRTGIWHDLHSTFRGRGIEKANEEQVRGRSESRNA